MKRKMTRLALGAKWGCLVVDADAVSWERARAPRPMGHSFRNQRRRSWWTAPSRSRLGSGGSLAA